VKPNSNIPSFSNPAAQHNKAEDDHLRRVREVMLQNTHSAGQTVIAAERIVPIDRARSFITLLVVLHHPVVNYTYFGNADRMRWLGFDLVVLFNDSSSWPACFSFPDYSFVTAWRAGDPQTSWPTAPGDWACRF